MTKALTTRTDSPLSRTKLTARDVFNIWLADRSEWTQAVYKAEVTSFLEKAKRKAMSTKF